MPGGVEICSPSDPQIPENANVAADFDDFDSACSTPYVSAPSSPGRCPPPGVGFFYYSAPTSPVHFILSSTQIKSSSTPPVPEQNTSFEFELHAAAGSTSSAAGSMSSADELFLNGQIRPMKLSSHLQRPQALAPLLDLDPHEDGDDDDDDDDKNANTKVNAAGRGRDNQMMLRDRSKSLRRRARSMSPLRSSNNNSAFQWLDDLVVVDDHDHDHDRGEREGEIKEEGDDGATRKDPVDMPAAGGTSSRSSSAGRSSRRWVFLKEFLYRSKSEGRSSSSGSGGHRFWSSFSASSSANSNSNSNSSRDDKDREKRSSSSTTATTTSSSSSKKGGKKRVVVVRSAHELHYTTNRAQAEEMRKKTFLPYRQGLLGCLGFSSKSYGALNGFARALNPVSSR